MILCDHCKKENAATSRFCTGCGAGLSADSPVVAHMRMVQREGHEEYVISEAEWHVGRDSANDLALGDPEVSGRHLKVVCEGKDFKLEDLNSRNGTFLNGERVGTAVVLTNGDLVKVGRTIFKFIV